MSSNLAEPDTTSAAADPRRWIALIVIATSTLMVVLDASIMNIALPHAQSALSIADADRHWVITAYTLAFGGLLLLGGRVADLLGRKPMFVIGLLGFAVASALGGVAMNAPVLFGARALQGVFAAIVTPAALSLISVTFVETRERAKAFAVYGAVAGGGGAVGLLLGGFLTEYANWRWCLFVNIPIAIVAAAFAATTVREDHADGPRRFDIPGAILVTVGLVALVYGFTEAGKAGVGWLAAQTLIPLAFGIASLIAFVLVEARTTHPLLPLRVVTDRNRGAAYLAAFLLGAGMFGMLLFITYYLQVNLGYEPLKAGLAFLPFSVGIISTASLASSLLPRFGPKPLMAFGMATATVGLAWMITLDSSSTYLGSVLPSELMMGIGLGLVFVPMSTVALSGIEPHDAGVASAVLNTSQQIGGTLGVALLNTLYAAALSRHVTASADVTHEQALLDGTFAGYTVAFTVGAALFAGALVVIIAMLRAEKAAILATSRPIS